VLSGTYSTLFIATPIVMDTTNDDKPTVAPAAVTPKLATNRA